MENQFLQVFSGPQLVAPLVPIAKQVGHLEKSLLKPLKPIITQGVKPVYNLLNPLANIGTAISQFTTPLAPAAAPLIKLGYPIEEVLKTTIDLLVDLYGKDCTKSLENFDKIAKKNAGKPLAKTLNPLLKPLILYLLAPLLRPLLEILVKIIIPIIDPFSELTDSLFSGVLPPVYPFSQPLFKSTMPLIDPALRLFLN